jgi:hypothetical protein
MQESSLQVADYKQNNLIPQFGQEESALTQFMLLVVRLSLMIFCNFE